MLHLYKPLTYLTFALVLLYAYLNLFHIAGSNELSYGILFLQSLVTFWGIGLVLTDKKLETSKKVLWFLTLLIFGVIAGIFLWNKRIKHRYIEEKLRQY